MGTNLTLWEAAMSLIGFVYVVNHHTGEIHDLRNKHTNCHTEWMRHKQYVGKRKMKKLLATKGYNGCRWCNKEYNKE